MIFTSTRVLVTILLLSVVVLLAATVVAAVVAALVATTTLWLRLGLVAPARARASSVPVPSRRP